MSADAFTRYLQAYCDGELDPTKTLEVEGHLQVCAACRRAVDSEGRFREGLRAKLPPEPVPRHLEERLRSALLAAEPAERQSLARRAVGRRLALVAAAILLVIAGGVVGQLIRQPTPRSGVAPVLTGFLEEHLRSTRLQGPVEIETPSARQVAFWFQGKIDRPVFVPDYGPMGVQLLGGRVIAVGERRAASVVYRKGQKILSLFAMPWQGDALTAVDLREVARGEQRYFAFETGGHQMLLWQRGAMIYALVSDVGWEALFQCAQVFFETAES